MIADLIVYDITEMINGNERPHLIQTKVQNTITPRYNHFSFYHKGKVYFVGGKDKSDDITDVTCIEFNDKFVIKQI